MNGCGKFSSPDIGLDKKGHTTARRINNTFAEGNIVNRKRLNRKLRVIDERVGELNLKLKGAI